MGMFEEETSYDDIVDVVVSALGESIQNVANAVSRTVLVNAKKLTGKVTSRIVRQSHS